MVETRTRILGIAPYEGMHAAMDRAAQAYPNVQMDVFTGDLDAPGMDGVLHELSQLAAEFRILGNFKGCEP